MHQKKLFECHKQLWEESLNNDGNQYQQNKQSPLILTEITEHKKDHDIWRWKSSYWGFGQAQICGGLNRLMWSHPFSIDYWISNGNTDINKR